MSPLTRWTSAAALTGIMTFTGVGTGGFGLPAAADRAGGLGSPLPLEAQEANGAVAIVNGEVHTISGSPIRGGTVLIENGRISAVGTDVQVPAGARVIDARGRIVTPGFLESATQLGIVELGAEAGPRDVATTDDRITASFNVLDGINPFAMAIPVTRVEGITRAIVAPAPSGSLIAGQGVLIDLGGNEVMEMVHLNPAGMFAVLGEAGSARAGGARGAAMQQLREAFQDARDLSRNRQAFESRERRDYVVSRLDLEALLPVLNGQVPLVVQVHRASDIQAALRLKDEFNLRMILTGVLEGWMEAERIRNAAVPVIIDPMRNLPGFESLGATLENAARLHAAGVTVAISSFDTNNARNIKQAAGNAVAHGMPHDAALRAVTLTPAEIWGIEDRFGSLEVGKDADVVVWSGDPFELSTRAEHVFIRGREIPQESRQIDLFNRYRTVP